MPSCRPEELPLTEIAPGYTSRLADWGGMTVVYERMGAGQDASLQGAERCQARHWGYLIAGSMTIHYPDRQESIGAGETYYVEPNHLFVFDTDCEVLEFTTTEELERTLEVLRANVG